MEGKINNYNNGKIYFLMNNINHEIFYIGSTTQNLRARLTHHKNHAFYFNSGCYDCYKCNYIRLMNINDSSGYNNISIHAIEEYPCNSKDELFIRERYWMELFNPSCNTFKPMNTKEEKREYMKEYHKNYENDNRDIIREYKKQYYEENKNIILEHRHQYYEKNKNIILELNKKYYEKNIEKYKQKILCDCGEYYTIKCKLRHQRTQLHRDIMRMNELD